MAVVSESYTDGVRCFPECYSVWHGSTLPPYGADRDTLNDGAGFKYTYKAVLGDPLSTIERTAITCNPNLPVPPASPPYLPPSPPPMGPHGFNCGDDQYPYADVVTKYCSECEDYHTCDSACALYKVVPKIAYTEDCLMLNRDGSNSFWPNTIGPPGGYHFSPSLCCDGNTDSVPDPADDPDWYQGLCHSGNGMNRDNDGDVTGGTYKPSFVVEFAPTYVYDVTVYNRDDSSAGQLGCYTVSYCPVGLSCDTPESGGWVECGGRFSGDTEGIADPAGTYACDTSTQFVLTHKCVSMFRVYKIKVQQLREVDELSYLVLREVEVHAGFCSGNWRVHANTRCSEESGGGSQYLFAEYADTSVEECKALCLQETGCNAIVHGHYSTADQHWHCLLYTSDAADE